MTFEIRKAEASDAPAILACLAAAFEDYRNQYTPAAFADTVLDSETIHRRLTEMSVLVAHDQGNVIGTIGSEVHGREGHLRGMAVLPGQQGSGVASELLRAAEAGLRAQGCELVTLDTTEPLRRAIRFYERNGYSATGKVVDFFGMRLYEYSKSL